MVAVHARKKLLDSWGKRAGRRRAADLVVTVAVRVTGAVVAARGGAEHPTRRTEDVFQCTPPLTPGLKQHLAQKQTNSPSKPLFLRCSSSTRTAPNTLYVVNAAQNDPIICKLSILINCGERREEERFA